MSTQSPEASIWREACENSTSSRSIGGRLKNPGSATASITNSAKPKPRCKVDTNADGVLEDLTDTGHCWHIGTGLDLIDALPSSTGPGADRARAQLRAAHAQPLSALAGNDEFTLVLVRRDASGRVEPVSAVADLSLLEKALRKLA